MENEQKMEMNQHVDSTSIKVKAPKRILHFSDGTLEEFSDDDAEIPSEHDGRTADLQQATDPKTLTWGPWMAYMLWAAGNSTLSICDYVGESLASMFGITSPKYYFEIEEYKRTEAARKAEEEKRVGWCEPASDESKLVTKEKQEQQTRINAVTPMDTLANTPAAATATNV